MTQPEALPHAVSVRQALTSADFAALADHCANSPGHVVRSCIVWRDEVIAREGQTGLRRWASVAGWVTGRLRQAGELSHALALAGAGEGMTRRFRAEEALALIGSGDVARARKLLGGDEPLARALDPIVQALSGGTISLKGSPKGAALTRLWAGARAVRELGARRLTAARRAAAGTENPWFCCITEHALRARGEKLSPTEAVELVRTIPEQKRKGPNAERARAHRTEMLTRAFMRDLLALSPEQEIDLAALGRVVDKGAFRYWFEAKFRALGDDHAALTRWVRGVSPEQVPRSLNATYYLWRSFLRIAAQRESAAKDVETAARLGADPVEVARAAFLIALRAEPEPSRLERATEELASTLGRAGGELEAAVARVKAVTAWPGGFYEGASSALTERWFARARDAAERLGADRAEAVYGIDCVEAIAIALREPDRARELARRAVRAFPERLDAWRVRTILAATPASKPDDPFEQLLEQAHEATRDPMFHKSARQLRMAAGRVEPFADLVWEHAEASVLIGEAFRYLVKSDLVGSKPESIERWCGAWKSVLEHRAKLRPGVRDAFDAGILAYAFGCFGASGSGRSLFEMCRASAPPAPAALASLIAPDSSLSRGTIVEIARQAVAAAAEHGSTLPPPRHPLCVLVSVYVALGLRDEAARLLGRVAVDVDAAAVIQATRILDDSSVPVRADWDALHDALHPTVCLQQLLSGDVDPRRTADDYQAGRAGELYDEDEDEDGAFDLATIDDLDDEESVDELLAELSAVAKIFRLDMDKVRALSGAELKGFLLELDELEAGSAEGLAAARRLAAEFGIARASEAPKMAAPASGKDKNRRKRERRARKGGKAGR